MYITIHLKNLTRMTIWNVKRIGEYGDYICIGISDQPDKEIPKAEIDTIRLEP